MTAPALESGDRGLLSCLCEITRALESGDESEERLLRVLRLLPRLIRCEQCALLELSPGGEPRIRAVPEATPEERAVLIEVLPSCFTPQAADDPAAPAIAGLTPGPHVSVPLHGLDKVIGVLFVRRSTGAYGERHVQLMSVVGAKIAAYLTMLRTRAVEAERSRELDEARRAAEAAIRTKDEFLALVSHELKTPLTATLAWAHLLGSTRIQPAERARAVEAIERNIEAHAKIVDEILDLSCIATASLRLDLRAAEPATLIKAAVDGLRLQAERRSIKLEAALDESAGPLIVDPDRFAQIVSSLLANAIKFTPIGGTVQVRLERTRTHARIEIIDSGKGITAARLPHVFGGLREVQGSMARAHEGLGVSLAIVKNLVELHGGRVDAHSAGADKGATFTVEFPLPGETQGRPRPRENAAEELILAGIRVLLVDDDGDIRDALQMALEHHGAQVTAAGSVAEALAGLERSTPDVLLTDLAMPGETGYDLMRRLAARTGPAPPAAAITASATIEEHERALAAGFRMHIAKPVGMKVLISAVASLAGRSLDAACL